MAMAVLRMPGVKELPKNAPKSIRSIMDTMMITPAGIERWKKPPFQREVRITQKVLEAAEELKKNGGVISGIITLGKLGADTYLVDGQHRIEAFKLADLSEGIADVRICTFDDMGEMGEEFARLNTQLVRFKTDDILRGLEGTNPHLQRIRKMCPFVGYDNLRHRGAKNVKLVAMSTLIRTWFGSDSDTPNHGPPSGDAARMLNVENTEEMIRVMTICFEAWGQDEQNFRLWGSLNLALTFWLWRKLVLRQLAISTGRRGGLEPTTLTAEQFRACLMALSANAQYIEWLRGRGLRERDRSPAYVRVKSVFVGRIGGMAYGKPILPQPDWASR